jgi:P-type E1-E2 ATPase
MSLFEYLDLKDGHGGFRTPRSRGILEQNLTALGIFGLQDPLRPGIFDSVLTC